MKEITRVGKANQFNENKAVVSQCGSAVEHQPMNLEITV